jgi:prepilin-type N-terminal cleavage/methylation domain-containing protein
MLTRTRKAFTLLELIVVIVILGVLALIAIPTYNAVIGKSNKSAAARTGESIGRDVVALSSFNPSDLYTAAAMTANFATAKSEANPSTDYTISVLTAHDGVDTTSDTPDDFYTFTVQKGGQTATVTITGTSVTSS